MSLRAMSRHGGLNESKSKDHAIIKQIYEIVCNKGRGFLLPASYPGCNHEWKQLDSGYCVCDWCGKEHNCYKGECPEITTLHSEKVCSITGCVIEEGELMAERSANERTAGTYSCDFHRHSTTQTATTTAGGYHHHSQHHANSKGQAGNTNKVLILFGGGSKLRETVECTVREILDSDKTKQCMVQEKKRYDTKISALFSKALREASHDHKCMRPNMVLIYSQVEYHCRKNRRSAMRLGINIENVIESCTESITSLLILFGGMRVTKQMQNSARCREFICSLLYLMRMGITYQNRQLLPKMELLNHLLPLQVLLPVVFKIRAKSITEGENIIKLDIRQMPLI
jgi:hypothetical protein